MRALFSSFPVAALVAGILLFISNPNASAQTSSTPGPLVQKVAAKLEGGKTLATASAPEIRQAMEDAAAENVGSADEMAVELLKYLSAIKGGLTKQLVTAVVKGAFQGSPVDIAATAEAVIAAFPEWKELVMKLLQKSSDPYGAVGGGAPPWAQGPSGVGNQPDDDDVTPDKPN